MKGDIIPTPEISIAAISAAVVTAARGADPDIVANAIDRALLAAMADVLPQPAQKLPEP